MFVVSYGSGMSTFLCESHMNDSDKPTGQDDNGFIHVNPDLANWNLPVACLFDTFSSANRAAQRWVDTHPTIDINRENFWIFEVSLLKGGMTQLPKLVSWRDNFLN